MSLSSPENWKDKDCVNDDIWSRSPAIQRVLAAQFPVGAPGSVGGQQAMFLPDEPDVRGTATNPLPWVPDLVGKNSDGPDAVMIIGSAYAPFVEGYSERHLPLEDYRMQAALPNWIDFQHLFLGAVVLGDASYYEKIDQVFGENFDWRRAIVTDWCRASFVRHGDDDEQAVGRADGFGDGICGDEGAGVFFSYVGKNIDWHTRRLAAFGGKIVLLGNLSHSCLNFLCQIQGWLVSYESRGIIVPRPNRLIQFWPEDKPIVQGQIHRGHLPSIFFTAIKHPSRIHGPPHVQQWGTRLHNWMNS